MTLPRLNSFCRTDLLDPAGSSLLRLTQPGRRGFKGAAADNLAGLSVMPQEETRDYYEDLQVSASAEPETIHRVYRLLAQQFHPDNGETGNETRFRAIAGAYEVLSDPGRRAQYDVVYNALRQDRW